MKVDGDLMFHTEWANNLTKMEIFYKTSSYRAYPVNR